MNRCFNLKTKYVIKMYFEDCTYKVNRLIASLEI